MHAPSLRQAIFFVHAPPLRQSPAAGSAVAPGAATRPSAGLPQLVDCTAQTAPASSLRKAIAHVVKQTRVFLMAGGMKGLTV